MNQKVVVLIGAISSGKSTYAKQLADDGFVILNDDSLIQAVHGGNYKLYSKKLKPLYKTIENNLICTALAMEKSVVVDRGLNVSGQARQRFISIARSMDVSCEAIVFKKESPEVHAQRRFDSDNRGHSYEHWLEAATRHNKLWEYPTLSEGFDLITYL